MNISWYKVVSSVNRISYWPSFDAWDRAFDNAPLKEGLQLPALMGMLAWSPLC